MKQFKRALKTLAFLLLAGQASSIYSAPDARSASASPSSTSNLRIDVLDVGQGDAILIRSPEGRSALVDAGTSSAVVDRLHEVGVTSLDMVVVSHHHTDHYGGMDDVIKAFKPKYYLSTVSTHTTSSYVKLLRLVRDTKMVALQPADHPRHIGLGSVQITVFPMPPLSEDAAEENNNSIGMRVTHGKFSMILTGDSEEDERAWWVQNCPELLRDASVLKLAHHGSHNGTDPDWLRLIQPELAVVSCGEGNDYGHPHEETVSLLARENIPLIRTDQKGTITLFSNGIRWRTDKAEIADRRRTSQDDQVEPASEEKVATKDSEDSPPPKARTPGGWGSPFRRR